MTVKCSALNRIYIILLSLKAQGNIVGEGTEILYEPELRNDFCKTVSSGPIMSGVAGRRREQIKLVNTPMKGSGFIGTFLSRRAISNYGCHERFIFLHWYGPCFSRCYRVHMRTLQSTNWTTDGRRRRNWEGNLREGLQEDLEVGSRR